MAEVARHKQLIVFRHTPYAASLARSATDLALAMGAFEQDVDLLFIGDAVLQLLDGQGADAIGQKNLGKILASLPLYDIEYVYVDAGALSRHGLAPGDLALPARPLDIPGIRSLMASCDHIVGF